MGYCTSKANYIYLESSEENAGAILQMLQYNFADGKVKLPKKDRDVEYYGYWDNNWNGLTWGWGYIEKKKEGSVYTYAKNWVNVESHFLPAGDIIVFEPTEWNKSNLSGNPRYNIYKKDIFLNNFEIKT